MAPSLLVNAGAMLERNSVTGSAVSPRASLSWQLVPGQTMRVGISRAQRTPTILENWGHYELSLPVQLGPLSQVVSVPMVFGPGNLRPERLLSREVAYLGRWPRVGVDIDVRLYEERVQDLITVQTASKLVLGQSIDYKTYVNRDDVLIRGVETQLGWRGSWGGLIVSHAYRHSRSNDESNVASVPGHIYGVLGFYRFAPAWEAGASFYHVDAMKPLSDGDALQGYDRVDLRLVRRFKMDGTPAEAALTLQNVTGPYVDFSRINEMKRRFLATLRLGF